MITIIGAHIYSTKGEMAYQLNYSDGTVVRAVESKDHYIRKEWHNGKEWVMSGKPYIVAKDKKRNAEWIKEEVQRYIKED